MRNLRHGSLQMDITNRSPKLQSCSNDSKSGILVQRIKVKKTVFNSYLVQFKFIITFHLIYSTFQSHH